MADSTNNSPTEKAKKKNYTKRDLDRFEKIITKLIDETKSIINHKLKSSKKAVAIESGETHADEMGTENQARELDFYIAQRETKFIVNLENALNRIQNKSYGKCRSCGNLIGKKRLELVPHATLCIDCKSDKERRD